MKPNKNTYYKYTVIDGMIQNKEGYEVTNIKDILFPTKHVKLYEGTTELFYKLSITARRFFDYFTLIMTEKNVFYSDENTYEKYNNFLLYHKLIESPLSHATIKRTIKEMVDLNLIYKLRRGKYIVNPVYAFRGSEEERQQLIGRIMIKTATNDNFVIRRAVKVEL